MRPRTQVELQAGWWAWFDRYELASGYLRPAADARFERHSLASLVRDADVRPPYVALADVVRQWRASGGTLTPQTEAGVLQWCRRFGLLGVLLQRVETVVFPPQAVPDDDPEWAGASQVHLLRTPKGWQQRSDGKLGAEAADMVWDDPGVMLHGLSSFEITREPIGTTWAKFFPSIPLDQRETYSYPHPMEEQFFRIYEEPIDEFLGAAAELTDALEAVAAIKAQTNPKFGPVSDFALEIHNLNGLASTVRWQGYPMNDGTVTEQWVAPTLLAALAMMALRDLRAGREPRICKNPTCKTSLYVSDAYQAKYCSERCRLTVNKRTYRRNVLSKKLQRRKRQATVRRRPK